MARGIVPRFARLMLLAVFVAGSHGQPAWAGEPVPHRAVYDIELASAKTGSGIAAVKGEMLAEWSESCEGWALDHRSLFEITYAHGATVRITSSVASWESRDGRDYHFNISNATNGNVTQKYEGRARLSADGGKVDYVEPKRDPMILPKGTVFPMVHTARVLSATAAAPTILSMAVFDGMSEEGTFRVSAVVGKPIMGATRTAKVARAVAALKGRPAWPMQLAYFSLTAPEAEPRHEVGMRIFGNGVSDRMLLDFGEFKVRADLIRLEITKKPACGS